jgi:RecJ-like exonuclease
MWEEFLTLLEMDRLYTSIQGKEIDALFNLLGPLAAVEYAIRNCSKWTIVNKVDHAGVTKASFNQKVSLADILVTSPPLGNKGEEKLIDILSTAKQQYGESQMKTLVKQVGGIDLIYSRIQGKERKQLRLLFPVYKSCVICGGDGRLYEAQRCTHCEGTGIKRSWPCTTCPGDGKNECWRCRGDGRIKDLVTPQACRNCRGTGKGWLFRKCCICGGDGRIFDNLPKDESCPKCLGSGNIECWRCGGTGTVIQKCGFCLGDGWTHQILDEQACWNCESKGKVLL